MQRWEPFETIDYISPLACFTKPIDLWSCCQNSPPELNFSLCSVISFIASSFVASASMNFDAKLCRITKSAPCCAHTHTLKDLPSREIFPSFSALIKVSNCGNPWTLRAPARHSLKTLLAMRFWTTSWEKSKHTVPHKTRFPSAHASQVYGNLQES